MSSILHDFRVKADPVAVYHAITTPDGLNAWWTRRAKGEPAVGQEYELWFGPLADWRARVTETQADQRFVLELTAADEDWLGTRVAFTLARSDGGTAVRFSHTGWPSENAHFRTSAFCWAMYLRLLRRYAETGEQVSYEDRLTV